jgi:signal peptidase I
MRGKTSRPIITGLVIIAGLLVIALKIFFIGHYRIPQNGMYPTLPAGSWFWAYKHAYSSPSQVKRGDVIVFTRIQDERPYIYIWRVVALPGDTVAAVGDSLSVNATSVTRERIREEQGSVIFRERLDGAVYEVAFNESPKQRPPDSTVIVPAGHFFVMGDNRLSAYDSRYFGPITFDSIIGKKL